MAHRYELGHWLFKPKSLIQSLKATRNTTYLSILQFRALTYQYLTKPSDLL